MLPHITNQILSQHRTQINMVNNWIMIRKLSDVNPNFDLVTDWLTEGKFSRTSFCFVPLQTKSQLLHEDS